MNTPRQSSGFTLIELIIVIVVVAILATLTIVTYNGVQSRARDTKIRAAAEHVQDGLEIYIAQTGRRPRGGWGATQTLTNGDCANGADGWFAKNAYGSGGCAPEEVLVAANLMPADMISSLPPNKKSGNTPLNVFMLYGCSSTKIILMWYLESPSAADTASYDTAMLTPGCNSQNFRDGYGMQGAAVIDI